MKRSEILHKIEEHMLQHEGGVRINVSRLLNMLEKEGMLPPAYVNGFFTAPYLGCDSADVEWVEESINEWEPENETQ